MEVFRFLLALFLILQALGSLYFWNKAEKNTLEELGWMIRGFGFTILLAML